MAPEQKDRDVYSPDGNPFKSGINLGERLEVRFPVLPPSAEQTPPRLRSGAQSVSPFPGDAGRVPCTGRDKMPS